MRSSEFIAFVYFVALMALAWIRPLPADRRRQITIAGVVMTAVVFVVGHHTPALVRDWAPGAFILAGYYVSGRFFVEPSASFEAWLMAWDRRVLGDPTTRFARWPRPLLAYLEIAYVLCFLLVPAGFALLAATGRAVLADRYWTMVLAAELGSFAPLGVIQTRPPWLVERPASLPDRAVHRVASGFVEQFTICANTFPSGHAAGSLAVALALAGAMPWASAVFFVLALSIGAASVVGRYHYVVDVVAGAALALAIWAVVSFSHSHV